MAQCDLFIYLFALVFFFKKTIKNTNKKQQLEHIMGDYEEVFI